MTSKLLVHFRNMQAMAARYIEPSGEYVARQGQGKANKACGETVLFSNDMIYMLDGPEQREAEEHASFDYLALSERTASGHFHGDLVNFDKFIKKLATFAEAAEELDRYKKLMFYGEDAAKGRLADPVGNGQSVIDILTEDTDENDRKAAEFIVHSILGVASEAGEMVEAVLKALTRQGDLDLVNLGEESGDVKWYLAMLSRVRGVAWDDDERINIKKLKARFPDKFTTEQANTRNLEAERTILEGKIIDGNDAVEARAEAALADAEPTENNLKKGVDTIEGQR